MSFKSFMKNKKGKSGSERGPNPALAAINELRGRRSRTLPAEPKPLPVLGRLAIQKQYLLVSGLLLLSILVLCASLGIGLTKIGEANREAARAMKLQMLSQRMAKAAQMSVSGDPLGPVQLTQARTEFTQILRILQNGSSVSPGPLKRIETEWHAMNGHVSMLLASAGGEPDWKQQLALIIQDGNTIAAELDQLNRLTNTSRAAAATTGATQHVINIVKGVTKMRSGNTMDAATVAAVHREAQLLTRSLDGLQAILAEERLSGEVRMQVARHLAAVQALQPRMRLPDESGGLANPKQAQLAMQAVLKDADRLLASTQQLIEEFNRRHGKLSVYELLGGASTLLALCAIVLRSLINVNEARFRAYEIEKVNERNQMAILRLLNEMASFADGDLTARATVTEEITGAIADSVNYTIDELRNLVIGINNATDQVASATAQAQAIARDLLTAAEKQSMEIARTNDSVREMAGSIQQVSENARESADVARISLEAAEKGAVAVQESVLGMSGIRDQIQETAKRMKRLGESSQEISEIVDLIADITEQTNILALNAAIQAAAAGEAGRGFSVVAEEVQRLAERSGEATKQIGALVKTIQTDTQDAVSAMERSTLGVVEGAKRSDAAGQALQEIQQVSQSLFNLIDQISAATRVQAEAAAVVAQSMQAIMEINTRTTEGTKQTAVSVGELASLAAALRSSVSGFKLS